MKLISAPGGDAATIVDVLRHNAERVPGRTAYRFAGAGDHDGGDPASRFITCGELDRRARAVAAVLRAEAPPGARVLVLVPTGPDLVAALAGCLYAGMCAVPYEPPVDGPAPSARFAAVGRDAEISAVLTTSAVEGTARRLWAERGGHSAAWIGADRLGTADAADEDARPAPADRAMLLYTSGSTGSPKGVMISHGNVMGALTAFRHATGIADGGTVVQWIPVYHSLGMGGHLLFSQYIGGECVVLDTQDAVARPAAWLRAISAADAPVLSGGPNFIYDRCVESVTDDEIAALDLARWHTALNGAERTRGDTLDRFTARFAPCGFRRDAFVPIFGLTETTLLVSARRGPGLLEVAVDAEELERGRVREVGRATVPAAAGAPAAGDGPSAPPRVNVLVGSGYPALGATVLIVDPDTREPLEDGRVGEVWVQGPSVTRGYWRHDEENERTFRARLANGDGPYLRTGDLGFFHAGEVVVCGRLKELLIIRGRNLHPQDVEATARAVHPALASAPAAAFSVDGAGGERLVLVQGVPAPVPPDPRALAEAVRRAVTAAHGADAEVVLVGAAQIPRTPAGKVRRTECRGRYLQGRLTPIEVAVPGTAPAPAGGGDRPVGELLRVDPGLPDSVVHEAVRRHVAAALGTDPDDGTPLAGLGLDSLRALELRHRLEREFGVTLPLAGILAGTVGDAARELRHRVARGDRLDEGRPVMTADLGHRYEPFPLTDLQRAYLVGRGGDYEVGGVSAHYFCEYDGDIDVPRLVAALARLVERHEMLRAVVGADGTQRILPRLHAEDAEDGPRLPVRYHDLRGRPAAEVAEHLDRTRREMSHRVLPLDAGPLFELQVTLLDETRVRVHAGIDLLIADVRSIQIFLSEWERLYRGEELPPIPPEVSFRDFVIAAARERDGAGYRRARDYWMDRIPSLPPAPDLPVTEAARTGTPHFVRLEAALGVPEWNRVTERAARYGVTPSAVLLAAYAVVLAAWSRSSRFTLNIPLFNRLPLHEDIGAVIGDFTSIVLLEVDVTEDRGIADLAGRIQRRLFTDMDHRHFSGVEVLRELARRQGGTAGTPAPVVFASGRGQGEGHLPGGWLGDQAYAISQTPQVWLDHQVYEKDGALLFNWDTVEGLFPGGVLEEMFGAYRGVLDLLAGDDLAVWEKRTGRVLPAGQSALVEAVNATAGAVPGGLLFSGIAAWAEREPGRRAVFSGGRWWSFGEVYGPACRLARRLRALGVGPGQLVPVVVEKGVAQITGALGVLLAGGGYLPVDPDLPVERQEFLVAHGQARVVVTGVGGRDSWPDDVPSVVVDLDDDRDLAGGPPEPAGGPDDVAYVIYTSGSTGVPKGVAVSHRAALNTCVDVCERFGVGAEDTVLGLSSLSFDLSVWDVFGVLGVGGGLVLPEKDARRDPERWLDLVTAQRVTVWNSVPALMQMFAEHAAGAGASVGLRTVLLSGDWIPLDLPERIWSVAPGARVVSLGGATEAAIWSIFHPVERVEEGWESIPYGRPLRNQTFHVLDDRLEPCPVWVTGELYIGGVGLAQGYWRDPDKTAASFITHPVTGERLYRTGDLGRWRPEGFIEFLGREDFQVKIGGFRIELGEIEAVLTDHPDVGAAVAAAVGADRHHRKLAAYVVPAPDRERGPEADAELAERVRALLGERLPSYMVPGTVTVLDRLPLTGNGKVDRSALPDPAAAETAAAEERPVEAGPLAFRLAAIAAEVIGAGEIDPRANFFEVGGDSITGVQIAARAAAEGIELSLPDLFEARTIAEAAAIIEARQASGDRERRPVPLTPLQRTLLAGAEDAGGLPGGAHWVELPVPDGFTLPPEAVRALLRRHPALRATFTREDAGWTQLVGETDPAAEYVPVVDLRMLPEERQQAALTEMAGEMRGELDPTRGPLARPALFDLADGRRLIWLVHELVADARSWEPLLRELAAMTSGASPGAGDPSGPDAGPRPADTFASWSREPGDAADPGPAPLPARRGPADHRAVASVPADTTAETLGAALDAYRATPAETAVAAVLAAIRAATGDPAPAADVECDIRESHGLDPRATVGPLARIVTVRAGTDPADLVPGVKRACREPALPDTPAAPAPAGDGSAAGVLVRVIGRLDDGEGPGGPVWPVWDTHVGAPVQATVLIEGGRLHVEFTAAPGDGDARRTADALAGALPAAFAAVRDHCRAAGAGGVTAADFPLAGLDEDDLAAVLFDASEEGA